MVVIEKFLGQRVEVPEDCRYDIRQGLWGQSIDTVIVFGLTQPALVLSGGVKDIDWLVNENQRVEKGEAFLKAIGLDFFQCQCRRGAAGAVEGEHLFGACLVKECKAVPANAGGGWFGNVQGGGSSNCGICGVAALLENFQPGGNSQRL